MGNHFVMTGEAIAPSDHDFKKIRRLCRWWGWLGLHRLRMGYIGTGFLWMFTFGLFLFGWLYDSIKISSGTFLDKFGRPVSIRTDIH